MTDEFSGTTAYVYYMATCPGCGDDATWLAWADQNCGSKDRALHLMVTCPDCAVRERASA